ncbi:type II secretion system minor pseudopilin GspK [Inhella crocodyli]|uniref:Type II secretion system protein K n=1 Tax=Inhella crocodyli TaxID=2499851 RepID=A0A3S2UF65_9BURK|nr:type II secretion system minor pseudopilin GspK [Inhella crocodyli]RVT86315.1 general secretion pathway protein GspK [Inhella crocodyli]
MRPAPLPPRGAALLTALLVVTLVATLAAAMVWQQTRAINTEAADRARSQATWVLQGALDWARLILREDARANQREPVDHLGEVWAVPLAEARLSTFLAAEQGAAAAADDGGPEAFLSGAIVDAQARYNLSNLLRNREIDPLEQRSLLRLCANAGVDSGSATRLVQQLRAASQSQTDNENADVPLRPRSVAQLRWLGLDATSVRRLEPWLIVLPTPTPVNVNTAPREVIAAVIDGLDLTAADRIVQARRNKPFRNLEELKPLLPEGTVLNNDRLAVSSSHFIVSGRLRLDERVVEQRSLVRRRGLEVDLVWRERVATVDPATPSPAR